MENKLTEQELADKITSLIKEKQELEFNQQTGVTLEKSHYAEDRVEDINKELSQLKTVK